MPFPNPLSRGTYLSPPYPAMHEDKSSQVKGGGWVTLGLSDVQPPPGQSVLTRTSAPQGPPAASRSDDARPSVALSPSPFGLSSIYPLALSCSAAHSLPNVLLRAFAPALRPARGLQPAPSASHGSAPLQPCARAPRSLRTRRRRCGRWPARWSVRGCWASTRCSRFGFGRAFLPFAFPACGVGARRLSAPADGTQRRVDRTERGAECVPDSKVAHGVVAPLCRRLRRVCEARKRQVRRRCGTVGVRRRSELRPPRPRTLAECRGVIPVCGMVVSVSVSVRACLRACVFACVCVLVGGCTRVVWVGVHAQACGMNAASHSERCGPRAARSSGLGPLGFRLDR